VLFFCSILLLYFPLGLIAPLLIVIYHLSLSNREGCSFVIAWIGAVSTLVLHMCDATSTFWCDQISDEKYII